MASTWLSVRTISLLDCKLNGKEIDDNKAYRVATLDYLAQGNDKLEAFKSATNLVSPQTPEIMFVSSSWTISVSKRLRTNP